MKKLSALLFFLAILPFAWSQTGIVNGGFEDWIYKKINENPTAYNSNAWSNVFENLPPSVIKDSVNKHSGNYAVKVMTVTNGLQTRNGLVVSVEVMPEGPDTVWGGFPYSQTPDSIKGFYKYFTANGDSAAIMVLMKKDGVVLTFDIFNVYGVQSLYKNFAYKLSVPATAPDTIVLAFISSNDMGGGTLNPGNWMIIDDISFTGPASPMPAIPNAGFESWYVTGYEDPAGWNSFNLFNMAMSTPLSVRKITPPYTDYYAASIKTSRFMIPQIDSSGYLSTGNLFNDMQGGFPMDTNYKPDSIGFYYKYNNSNATFDSAAFYQSFSRWTATNGQLRLNMMMHMLPAASVYKFVSFPFDLTGPNPDTCMITFASSHPFNKKLAGIGNELIIDNITFYYGNVGIPAAFGANGLNLVYPNPAKEIINLRFTSAESCEYNLKISDINGRLGMIIPLRAKAGLNEIAVDVRDLSSGSYLYVLEGKGSRFGGQLIIE